MMTPSYILTLLPLLALSATGVTARDPAGIRKVQVHRRGTCAHKPSHGVGGEGERNLTRPDHWMYGPGSNSSSAPSVQVPIASSSVSIAGPEAAPAPAPTPTPTPSAAVFAPNVTISSSSAVSASSPTSSLEVESSSSASDAAEVASSSASSSSAAPAPSASVVADTGDADADLFVKLHNDFRAQYGAPAVSWDPELASFAASYAPICQMTHSSGPYGENLAGGAGGGYDITSAFNAWAGEAKYYDWTKPGVLEATNEEGNEVGLGHFTQVVWKATDKIGCAKVACADGTLFTGYGESVFVVCEYSPAGNVYMSGDDANSLFVENVGQKV